MVNVQNLLMDKVSSFSILVSEKSDHIHNSQKLMNLLSGDYWFKTKIRVVVDFIIFDINN